MFRKNDQHLQFLLFSSIDSLPGKQLGRLEASWANTFYHEFFVRISKLPRRKRRGFWPHTERYYVKTTVLDQWLHPFGTRCNA